MVETKGRKEEMEERRKEDSKGTRWKEGGVGMEEKREEGKKTMDGRIKRNER